MNNLANLKDGAEALKYAEQAYNLAPNDVTISDTYGWILTKQGKLDEGLNILKNASSHTKMPSINYHYAAALAKAGKKADAKKLLVNILNTNMVFEERTEAKTLLNSLN